MKIDTKKHEKLWGKFEVDNDEEKIWRPLGESNSCCKDENLESWATRRRGRCHK